MKHIYYPYIIGTDDPIPHLFENIAPIIAKDYEITIHSSQKHPILGHENINEIYTPADNPRKKAIHYAFKSTNEFDIIHTGGNGIIGYGVSKISKMRSRDRSHIHTLRVDVDPSHEGRNTWIRKQTSKSANIVTAVSKHTADTGRTHFDLEIHVIYNGVDTKRFDPDKPRPKLFDNYGIDKNPMVFVGKFWDRKNPLDVIKVAKRIPDTPFLMIGDGPLLDEAGQKSSNLENVYLTGQLPKSALPAIYSNSAGLIFPTIQEGCPNVVLEAMSSGIPVVGYRETSMPELVESGKNGYLCERGDIETLSEYTISIINDSGKLGEEARKYILNNHDFEIIGGQYLDLYNTI